MGWLFEVLYEEALRRGENPETILCTYAAGRLAPGSLVRNPRRCVSIAEAEWLFERHFYRPRFYHGVVEGWDQTQGYTYRITSQQIDMTHLLPRDVIPMVPDRQASLFSADLNMGDQKETPRAEHARTHQPARRGRSAQRR